MNIIERFNSWRDERRRERLRGDLEVLQRNDFGFNPMKVQIPQALLESNQESVNIAEYLTWFSGSGKALFEFYKQGNYKVGGSHTDYDSRDSYFWSTCHPIIRHIHSGLPKLISTKWPSIIMRPGFKISCVAYADRSTLKIDEKKTKYAQDLLDQVLDKVRNAEKLESGMTSESWSGHIAFKLSYDFALSPFPILEVYDRRFFEIVKNRGITQAIIFKNYYDKKFGNQVKQYVQEETYRTNKDGDAVIEEKLYEIGQNKKQTEVSLDTIEETACFLDNPIITFTGFKGLLAFEKPNIVATKAMVNNPYGMSDYDGDCDTFDAIDEVVSQLTNEIRDNKPIREWDESLVKHDSNGFIYIDKYITNYVMKKHDPDQNAKEPVKVTEFNDKTMEHYQKYKVLVTEACINGGVSPISLGIVGLESIASSDNSMRERARTTIDTRNKKIKIWKPFIETYVGKLLEFTSWLQGQANYPRDPSIPMLDLDYANTDVKAIFPDYVSDSTTERITTWGQAKANGLCSIEMGVKKIHGDDLTPIEVLQEVNLIKFEQGMSSDNPDLLNLDNEPNDEDNNPPTDEQKKKEENKPVDENGKPIVENKKDDNQE